MSQKTTGFFLPVLFGMFLLAGCGGSGGGSDGGSGGGSFSNTESGSAADYDLAETLLSDVADMVDEEASDETGLQKGAASSKAAHVGCGTVEFDASTTRSMTLDFGAGCKGRHDRNRQGKIQVTFSGRYKEEGSTATVNFSNYRSDGHQVEGSKTITNLGRNDAGNLVYQVITDATITTANGAIIEWLSTLEREWTEGEETPDRDDDVYTILNGVAHWTNSNFPGETFGSEITEPVVIELVCKFKLHGIVHIKRNGNVIVKIKYKAKCEPHVVEDDDDDNDEDDGDDDDNDTPENHPPTIEPLPTQEGTEGEAGSLQVIASDSDGDTLIYSAEGLPPDLTIDPATGLISGTFSCESAGNHMIIVTVSDGTASATDAFLGIVAEACDPPVITNPGDQTSAEGDAVSLPIVATHPTGGVLTYSAEGLPADLTIDPATGLISGTLSCESAGTPSVTVTATDGIDVVSETFVWTVTEACDPPLPIGPPLVENPGPQTNAEGAIVSLQIVASDPDNNDVVYNAEGLPPGLTISALTGAISGSPTFDSAGDYPTTVTVTDSTGSSVDTVFSWTVTNTNRPPEVTNPGNQTSAVGATVSLQIMASDPDLDPLTYGAEGLPDALTINATTGLISGTIVAGLDGGGTFTVTVTVSDGTASVPTNFLWTVTVN